jgi:hypothetical protein
MNLQTYPASDRCDMLLDRALTLRFCPICSILQDRTYNLLCELQLEAVRNEEINALVLSAGGYCHFHFWYLEHLASAATNAQLLEGLLTEIEEGRLEGMLAGTAVVLADRSQCPVCRDGSTWEQNLLASFIRKISDQDFRAVYNDSRGLCLPHLVKISTQITDRNQRTFLLDGSRRQLRTLLQELKLLLIKRQNSDHSPGAERDSVYRAIGKLVGGKHYRAG